MCFFIRNFVTFKNHNRMRLMSIRIKYFIIGALFGTLFPLGAYIFELNMLSLSFSLENLKIIHEKNLLLYMIDSAPLFLGLFALIGGISKDRSVRLIKRFESMCHLLYNKTGDVESDSNEIFTHLGDTIGQLKNDYSILLSIYLKSNREVFTATETAREIGSEINDFKNTLEALSSSYSSVDQQNNIVKKYLEKYLSSFSNLVEHIAFLDDFSRQIEMLAINSSIEANHLGNEAKSFLVFADTIHRLVQDTKTRNHNILKMIEALSAETEQLSDILTNEATRIEKMNSLNQEIERMTGNFNTLNLQFIDHLENINQQLKQQDNYSSAFDNSMGEMTSASQEMFRQLQNLIGSQINIIHQLNDIR